MMHRRLFLRRGSQVSLGFLGLRHAIEANALRGLLAPQPQSTGYGPLIIDPNGVLDLPQGFSYVQLHLQGQSMSDGLVVPGRHDGMAAFAGANGRVVLVVNHELTNSSAAGPFGETNQLLPLVPPGKLFDIGGGRTPSLGERPPSSSTPIRSPSRRAS